VSHTRWESFGEEQRGHGWVAIPAAECWLRRERFRAFDIRLLGTAMENLFFAFVPLP
jgi:hypothetical protein